MAFINIRRRCDECEKTRKRLDEIERELDNFRLDYHALYEKVRTNLAKLAKRAERAEESTPEDPMQAARQALIARKLQRSQGG